MSRLTRILPESSIWLEFALILLVFFIHGGAPAPHVNETYYLTKAKHYWDPQWCAGDFFLESADAHLVFYWSVGWLAKFCSLPAMAWLGRIAAWSLLAWSWQRLCRCVTQKPFVPVLGAGVLVWLTAEHNFAGEWVVGGVEGKCFAYACVFAGLADISQSKWPRAWPWFGLAGAFHVLVGGWSALAAGAVWLCQRRGERPALAGMAPSLALAIVLALPGLIPALMLTRGAPPGVASEANQIYVFDRLPHHLAPFAQDSEVILTKALRFALPLFAFVLLWSLRNGDDDANVNPSSNPSSPRRLTPGDLQGRGTGVALNRICQFASWSLFFSVAGLLWELACVNHPALAASLLKYYWFRLADVAVPLAATLLACHWIESLLRRQSNYATPALALAIGLAAWHLTGTTVSRWQDPTPPADKNLFSPAAWRETCDWIGDNTPVDALLLVPRSAQSLSWYTGRKSLVTWKDVPQDAAGLVAWRDRYQDVFWHVDQFGEFVPYGSLGEAGATRIRELAAKYGVDFVVAEEYPPLPLPIAYKNAAYAVYALSPVAQNSVGPAP